MMIIKCPACNREIEISEDPNIGFQLTCIHCSIELEVTWLFPLTLDLLEKNSPTYSDLVIDEE
jgi:hypothetical protein